MSHAHATPRQPCSVAHPLAAAALTGPLTLASRLAHSRGVAFLDALADNESLTQLDLYGSDFGRGPQAAEALAGALLRNRALRWLRLSTHFGGSEGQGLEAVFCALGGPTAPPKQQDRGSAAEPSCCGITYLDIGVRQVEDGAVRALGASVARGARLEALWAPRSQVTGLALRAFAAEVARAAAPTRLRELNVSANGIGAEGAIPRVMLGWAGSHVAERSGGRSAWFVPEECLPALLVHCQPLLHRITVFSRRGCPRAAPGVAPVRSRDLARFTLSHTRRRRCVSLPLPNKSAPPCQLTSHLNRPRPCIRRRPTASIVHSCRGDLFARLCSTDMISTHLSATFPTEQGLPSSARSRPAAPPPASARQI